MIHSGTCHCDAIPVTLETPRPPEKQILGQWQCSLRRKRMARALSDPGSHVELIARTAGDVAYHAFGLPADVQILCRIHRLGPALQHRDRAEPLA